MERSGSTYVGKEGEGEPLAPYHELRRKKGGKDTLYTCGATSLVLRAKLERQGKKEKAPRETKQGQKFPGGRERLSKVIHCMRQEGPQEAWVSGKEGKKGVA